MPGIIPRLVRALLEKQPIMGSLQLAALILLTLCAASARAEELQYDQVEFAVQAEIEVENDLAEIVLAAESDHADPAALAGEINSAMSWALKQARGAAGIEIASGNYQTFPVYDKERLHHWHASQALTLRSQKMQTLMTLVGALQQRLQVKSMQFLVSPATQRTHDAELTDQLMERFKERASRIQLGLGAKAYRLVRLTVEGAPPPPRFGIMAGTAMMEKEAGTPVAGEAGSSRQRLDARAVIQLQF